MGLAGLRYGERKHPGLRTGRAYRGGTEGAAWRALCRSDHVRPQGTCRPALKRLADDYRVLRLILGRVACLLAYANRQATA